MTKSSGMPDPAATPTDAGAAERAKPPRTGAHAVFVATGILFSRIFGLIRQRVFSHYFGLTAPADAFTAGFRIPNFLSNLFGEGALSASFIPVYAALLARGERKEADRVAGAIMSLLALSVSALVLAGVLGTPFLIDAIAPGFTGDTRELCIRVVRILFPGMGLMVMSAWCLGVLNSHRRFLISYSAPVVWNVAMIVTLIVFGGRGTALPELAAILAWGSVAGSALMFAVQLPAVWAVAPGIRPAFDVASEHVRTVIRNFAPVLVSRGVVQLSGYVDTLLSTLLPTGAAAALLSGQTISLLPVSLFGMSVSAAELPAMSGTIGLDPAAFEALRRRLEAGLRQIAFFVVPSAVAFLALGDVIAAALFQTGRFRHGDVLIVWGVLAGSAVGLLASTLGRLYSSTYYALRDTRTPLNYAILRVVLTTVLGYLCAIPLPGWLGIDGIWGTAGLTASAGVAGWVEMLLLRRTMNARIGRSGLAASYVAKLWTSALVGALAGWGVRLALPSLHPIAVAILVLVPYGLAYFATALALRVPEASSSLRRLRWSP
jgi:putative peptidoglycan lipid II flippase